jgi:hypothetical protein
MCVPMFCFDVPTERTAVEKFASRSIQEGRGRRPRRWARHWAMLNVNVDVDVNRWGGPIPVLLE